ncbi:hypothetical protein N7470_005675 [Penicillium chermesinum]|nr:hypothetical protein N7470_005675 [Penicillium chermesinum]
MGSLGPLGGVLDDSWPAKSPIDVPEERSTHLPHQMTPPLPATPDNVNDISVPSPSQSTVEGTTARADLIDLQRDFRDDMQAYLPVGTLESQQALAPEYISSLQLLAQNRWIGVRATEISNGIRIYVNTILASRTSSQKGIGKLRKSLKFIMSKVDSSPDAWEGHRDPQVQNRDMVPAAEEESLWHIYNTLQNPKPNAGTMKDPWSRRAMEEVLSGGDFKEYGLKTDLFPYQRRSAAMMIQREAQPALMLDPRLQELKTPLGLPYYYDKEEGCIVREKSVYSEACGGKPLRSILIKAKEKAELFLHPGILAETMGGGKTLICLAVIWATRGHLPQIPVQYQSPQDKPNSTPIRERTGSLMDMAAAAAGRHSKPWKSFFLDRQLQENMIYKRCIEACKRNPGSYEIPPPPSRYQGRNSTSYPRPPAKRILICSGTLVIVPKNLVDHWESEIAKHTEGLEVLVLRNSAQKTPSAEELLDYDIVLFDRHRFEREAGEPLHNRSVKWNRIDSPLTQLHWLRVIVDEGHNVAGNGGKTNMSHLLDQLHIERRWVISGTPSAGLYGVEISLASQEASARETESPERATAAALEARNKTGNAINNEMKTLNQLRRIVVDFLGLKPWSNSKGDDPADWTTYMKPIGEDGKRRKSLAIRATLQGLVVRHQLDVVHQENILPPLYNKPVYLEPTFYDKLSINLFIFGLAVNSITSERQGPDYMFAPSNRKDLNLLISNLRQAGFWWIGSNVNLEDSLKHATKYMDKNLRKMSKPDIETLEHGMKIARRALGSIGWNHFKQLQELGVYLMNFPEDHRMHWSLSPDNSERNPMLMGITQARYAQKHVTEHLRSLDPTEGFSGAGISTRKELSERDAKNKPKKGAPESSASSQSPDHLHHSPKPSTLKLPKKTFDRKLFRSLPDDSPLNKTQLVATASAKLTYLLDQIIKYQATEKIIIFYENDNTAFWIAEGLSS